MEGRVGACILFCMGACRICWALPHALHMLALVRLQVLMRGGDDGTVQLFAGGEYLGCLPNNDSPASNVKMGALTCLRISKDSKVGVSS